MFLQTRASRVAPLSTNNSAWFRAAQYVSGPDKSDVGSLCPGDVCDAHAGGSAVVDQHHGDRIADITEIAPGLRVVTRAVGVPGRCT